LFASAAGVSPTRLVVVHRPCGTFPDQFFPASADPVTFTLPPILQPFAAVKDDMVILNGITCPRDTSWQGDQHGAGLITMMSGRRQVEIPGTSSGGDPNAKNQCAAGPSFDQLMLQTLPAFQGTATPSMQSAAYRPSSIGLPNFKVLSYTGPNGGLFPESRADTLFSNLFRAAMPSLPPEALDRLRVQQKGIVDFVHKDLARLRTQVPRSQLQKLDAHLAGIIQLEGKLAPRPPGELGASACKAPNQVTLPNPATDVSIDEAQHKTLAQNQLAILLTAFQCDLTRVATFSFAHGNSALRFSKILPGITEGGGHHEVSHIPTATGVHAQIDTFYSQLMAEFIQNLKATPDGDGTLLDHTLVVYLNECCIGNTHSINNMPLLMFGGKNLKLQTGRHLRFTGNYMNDVWTAVAGALGAPMPAFGDAAFNKGAVAGLFG
jgi:hypothetical protein